MTAPDPRVGEIEARLSAATPGPWDVMDDSYRSVPVHRIGSEANGADVAHVAMFGQQTRRNATFIANAPADVAYLLAELRKAHEALSRVETPAEQWTKRGEHDMAFSKTVPDEDIAMVLLTEGASMVENARHIRAAVAAANGDGNG